MSHLLAARIIMEKLIGIILLNLLDKKHNMNGCSARAGQIQHKKEHFFFKP